jgi:hypothetical protein
MYVLVTRVYRPGCTLESKTPTSNTKIRSQIYECGLFLLYRFSFVCGRMLQFDTSLTLAQLSPVLLVALSKFAPGMRVGGEGTGPRATQSPQDNS